MGGSTSLVAGGTAYTAIQFGGSATIVLLFLNNAVLRGAGDATRAMRALWLANAVNLVLDPCLIFGWGPLPELGLAGAAIATTIGRGTGVVYQFVVLGRGTGRIRVGRWDFVPDWRVLRRLLRVSLGGVGQYLVATASWVIRPMTFEEMSTSLNGRIWPEPVTTDARSRRAAASPRTDTALGVRFMLA